MQTLRAEVAGIIERIKALIPNEIDPKAYLRDCLDWQIAHSVRSTSLGITVPFSLSSTQRLASARLTVELIGNPTAIAERPEGIVELATIEWLLRPSMPIRKDQTDVSPNSPWKDLDFRLIEKLSEAVCRLDLIIEGYAPQQIGSGFIIGRYDNSCLLILTNRHVVETALRFGWRKLDGVEFVCNFERFSTSEVGTGHAISREHEIRTHASYDLSVIILETELECLSQRAERLAVETATPSLDDKMKIGVIGHPSFDSTRDPFPKVFGFGDQFGIKRFSPGYARGMQRRLWGKHEVELFLHDASTLSGSSGSCILDLNTNNVIGLHFGGWPLPKRTVKIRDETELVAQLFESNGAVPLWLLARDPILNNVRFASV